jgi:hypothetical protein
LAIFLRREIQENGSYRFSSCEGISICVFRLRPHSGLLATAPSTRNISLGSFANTNMNYLGDGRRVVGRFGDGSATITGNESTREV